jgi:alpha-ketoglutarate-dependent taurine dioxygenase
MTQAAPATTLHADLRPGHPPVLRVDPGGDAAVWAATHAGALRALVAEHGALFVRGLGLRDSGAAEAVFQRLGQLRPETEAFTPRRRYSAHLYSASKWPPNQVMCQHHELSYALAPPRLMLFACLVAPVTGGATPLADATAVLEALPAKLVEYVGRVGWLLTRNYHDDVGTSLAEAFGTEDRAAIEAYCRANAIEFQWGEGGVLRTWQRRGAVVRHPHTHRQCWFNQIAFLNAWTMAPEVREYLVDLYGPEGLPFDTRFGDGTPIGAEVVETINAAYTAHTVRAPWEAGDLLLVDNLRTAHGRDPYEGPREVVVAMADAVHAPGT